MQERLVAAAIIRNHLTEARGFKSHSDIRRALGDDDPYQSKPGDMEGFLAFDGRDSRWVDRWEARAIGYEAGQVMSPKGGQLLSSEVNWAATKKARKPARNLAAFKSCCGSKERL